MIRRIIEINEEKCNGCGACAAACHEGAIAMIDGKAKLIRDDYCDGLGDCLPTCPTGAIKFIEREAAAYDEAAVQENMKKKQQSEEHAHGAHAHGATPCAAFNGKIKAAQQNADAAKADECCAPSNLEAPSRLQQWPAQIKLMPVKAPYYDGAKLLIAADCTAYAYASFHEKFMKGHVTVIGCPKLDAVNYAEKLTEIIKNNDIKSVTIVRMEVPCCGGLEMAARNALQASGKFIPWQVVTISIDGKILD